MDWTMLIIFAGLIFTGAIIAYPIGHILGKRQTLRDYGLIESKSVRRRRHNLEKKDVVFAEYLEEKK